MSRWLILLTCLLFGASAAAQQSPYEQCKSDCYAADKPCRKQCPLIGGGDCKKKCQEEIPACQARCASEPGECSVYSFATPYSPDALIYGLALSAPAVTEATGRAYLALLGTGGEQDEFKIERWVQDELPRATAYLKNTRACIERNSRVRLFRFVALPRYTFDGGYFDFTPLRDTTLRIYSNCERRESAAVRFKGSDDALRFVMPAREAEYLVHVTRKEEPTGGVQIGVSINGGGPSAPTFSDHIVRDSHPKPVPELGEANVGFYGRIARQVDVRQVEKGDPLAPLCRRDMAGGAAGAALPQFNETVAGKVSIFTLDVDEIRIEDRRYGSSVQRREGQKN